jgi:Flp pilus assembly pilin Flp
MGDVMVPANLQLWFGCLCLAGAASGRRSFLDLMRDERGSTATEYALIAGFLSVLILFGVTDIGNALISIFTDTADALN